MKWSSRPSTDYRDGYFHRIQKSVGIFVLLCLFAVSSCSTSNNGLRVEYVGVKPDYFSGSPVIFDKNIFQSCENRAKDSLVIDNLRVRSYSVYAYFLVLGVERSGNENTVIHSELEKLPLFRSDTYLPEDCKSSEFIIVEDDSF